MSRTKKTDLSALENTLGHKFANPAILALALTHGSVTSGDSAGPGGNYQRLEFLGDRVLGLVVADMLDVRFPRASEGELSRWFHRLVSGSTCAEVARELDLGKHLRMSGQPSTGVLGDACESVIGAVYRDGGLAPATRLIERFWAPRIETMSSPPRDAKTDLQEWAHKRGFDVPAYRETERSGPDHAPVFVVEVRVGSVEAGQGTARSKREAEQEAAAGILRREGVWSKA